MSEANAPPKKDKLPNNPEYRVLLPLWEGDEPQFDLTPAQRKTILGGTPHRVAPQDKRVPVHERASTCEALLAVYPDAISVGSVMGTAPERGFVGFGGWAMLLSSLGIFWFATLFDGQMWGAWVLFSLAGFFFLIVSFYFLKGRYFLPKDQPVLFNRRTREVTFSQVRFHPFWKFWIMPGFEAPVAVAWDAVQARSYKFTQFMGSTLRESYRLELWGSLPQSPRVLSARAAIGYLGWNEDELLWRLYEHIRRYMEEDGPAIQPGEALRKPKKGRDLAPFPEAVLSTLGGPALSEEQVEAMAHVQPEPQPSKGPSRSSFLPPRKE